MEELELTRNKFDMLAVSEWAEAARRRNGAGDGDGPGIHDSPAPAAGVNLAVHIKITDHRSDGDIQVRVIIRDVSLLNGLLQFRRG